MSEGCIFSNGNIPCRKVTVAGVELCPRHDALVSAFGMEEAQGREYGYTCASCSDKSEAKPEKCKRCRTKSCTTCQLHEICCAESEISELEDEIAEKEADLAKARRNREKKVAANA